MRKLALVTGAGVRLGRAIAEQLAQQGYDLLLHHRSSPLDDTLKACRDLGAEARCLQADLNSEREVLELAAQVEELDLLVNNAAIFYATPTAAEAELAWSHFHQINLKAPFLLSTRLFPKLADRGGNIVNVIDIYSRFPLKDYTPYCVSKAGLEALTRCQALEFAPVVRVNGVSPGAALPTADAPPGDEERLAKKIPLGRLSGAEPIAEAVAYLAGANSVTGQILAVDGGRTLRL